MAITNWRGGKTGNEVMPAGYVSLRYTEIYREVPLTHQDGTGPQPIGYYTGDTNAEHHTLYTFKTGTLLCYVNNQQVEITRLSNFAFRINSATPGYVRVSYIPWSSAKYYSDSRDVFPLSSARTRICPSLRTHIETLIDAVDRLSIELNAIRRRFSIEEYTGLPLEGDYGVLPKTLLVSAVMNELQDHIVYLYEYARSSLALSVVVPEYSSYNYKHLNAQVIEQLRSDINVLEQAVY